MVNAEGLKIEIGDALFAERHIDFIRGTVEWIDRLPVTSIGSALRVIWVRRSSRLLLFTSLGAFRILRHQAPQATLSSTGWRSTYSTMSDTPDKSLVALMFTDLVGSVALQAAPRDSGLRALRGATR